VRNNGSHLDDITVTFMLTSTTTHPPVDGSALTTERRHGRCHVYVRLICDHRQSIADTPKRLRETDTIIGGSAVTFAVVTLASVFTPISSASQMMPRCSQREIIHGRMVVTDGEITYATLNSSVSTVVLFALALKSVM